eukprot:TRINITY_DN1018_c3_g1_i2.p1 TRINITY_DN1018_c3_g1~~TRINITY_DN1018_c3_g1_i2.p1  ORF type:complete len:518 (+),score=75.54 TRINITY_DN1018_c3_g1_i2:83-1636(+)
MKHIVVGVSVVLLAVGLLLFDSSRQDGKLSIESLKRQLIESREEIRKKDQGMSELFQKLKNNEKQISVATPLAATSTATTSLNTTQLLTGGPLDTAEGYKSVPWAESSTPLFSSSHCIGQLEKTKPDPDHWKKGTCHFKNLCFDPKEREFLYFARPSDPFSEELNAVAIGAINEQWNPVDKLKVKWSPRVIKGPTTQPYYLTSADELWIPHFEHCGANVMHLLMDSFYIIHAAALLFNLQNKHYKPLRYILKDSTLWGTCDFIKQEEKKGTPWAVGYYSRCTKAYERWAEAFLPAVDGQRQTAFENTRDFQTPGDKMICFQDSVVGFGLLSDHCLKAHGWSWDKGNDVTRHDCNMGRGRTLWSFRNRMMRVAGSSLPPPTKHLVSLYTMGGFSQGNLRGPNWAHIKTLLIASVGNRSAIEPLAMGTAKQQLDTMSQTTCSVVCMGGNSITALFMPRGAGLLLLHRENTDRLDWDVWSHASHINAAWERGDAYQNITARVASFLDDYEAFGEGAIRSQ